MIIKIKQTNKQTNKKTKTKKKKEKEKEKKRKEKKTKQNKTKQNKTKQKQKQKKGPFHWLAVDCTIFHTAKQPSSFKMTAVEMASRTVFPPGP